jgi:uncharacterized protein YjbJ (UPF0337 family)
MSTKRFTPVIFLFLSWCVPVASGQSTGENGLPVAQISPGQVTCNEAPREDALPFLCAPPTSALDGPDVAVTHQPAIPIHLGVPVGSAIRIAIDQRVRISRPGETVHGRVVETVYAFDSEVIPAGSVVTGRVAKIDPVSPTRHALAYANGNFSPFRKYEVTFDKVTLPDGKELPIKTTVSPGTADVVHLVSNPAKETQKSAAGRAADNAKQEAKGKVQEAKDQVHDSWQKLTAPGRVHRLKEFLVAQSPYQRQYLQPGTRFVAALDAPLDFGATSRSGEQLAAIGSQPMPDSTLKARLVGEVSSATAKKGTQVDAVLTEPLYSPTHQLILPVNSRLIGEVTQAQAARNLHRNGQLRLRFVRIEEPQEATAALAQLRTETQQTQPNSQAMVGNVEGLEVDRRANIKLDEEGGARTTDSKTRYLSTGLTVLLAVAASHPDAERGTTDAAGDPGVRTAAGGSGFRLVGALLSLVAKSTPVSAALGAYGASSSIYVNFLSRGRDVVLPKDTPIEIGFGPPHATPTQQKEQKANSSP